MLFNHYTCQKNGKTEEAICTQNKLLVKPKASGSALSDRVWIGAKSIPEPDLSCTKCCIMFTSIFILVHIMYFTIATHNPYRVSHSNVQIYMYISFTVFYVR